MGKKIREEKPELSVAGVDPGVPDSLLIEAARQGDKKAFGRLIRRHQKRLFRFVYGLTGSFDQTEDVVQDAFVRAYSAMDRFREGAEFYPWLSTIARNLAFNLLKREERKESLDRKQEFGFDTESGEAGPLEKLLASEGQKRFYAALRKLPEKYRTVFVLRHFEDMNYQEIAQQLKIPVGTVDSRLHRARQTLAEALKDLL
jgi:RNA polymerase sigma-70 factor (ECF subfamily)